MELFSRSSFFLFFAREAAYVPKVQCVLCRDFLVRKRSRTTFPYVMHKRSQTDQQYAPISTITSKLFCSQYASFHEGIKNSVLLSHYSEAVRLHTTPQGRGAQV